MRGGADYARLSGCRVRVATTDLNLLLLGRSSTGRKDGTRAESVSCPNGKKATHTGTCVHLGGSDFPSLKNAVCPSVPDFPSIP